MRTIKLITPEMIVKLRAEPQVLVSFEDGTGRDLYLPKRIADRVTIDGDCWRVSGWNTGKGHANVCVCNKTQKVHRVTYVLLIGPIPDRHVLDHKKELCKFRDCCNPWHLEPVTQKENTYRGSSQLFKEKAA